VTAVTVKGFRLANDRYKTLAEVSFLREINETRMILPPPSRKPAAKEIRRRFQKIIKAFVFLRIIR
jgi:hypothetical protein